MIASVTVSATTICSKLIVQRKTSYKSNVIYQKWFGTEDGKPSEYNRNAAKKRVPYLHLQKFLSTSHMNALEELSLSVLRVGASEAMVPATQGMKCLHRKTQLFPLLMPLLVFVWVGGSGVNAPDIGWSQMAPLLKEKYFPISFGRERQETAKLLLKIWPLLQIDLLPIVVQFWKTFIFRIMYDHTL